MPVITRKGFATIGAARYELIILFAVGNTENTMTTDIRITHRDSDFDNPKLHHWVRPPIIRYRWIPFRSKVKIIQNETLDSRRMWPNAYSSMEPDPISWFQRSVLSNAHWICICVLDVSDDFNFGIFDSCIYLCITVFWGFCFYNIYNIYIMMFWLHYRIAEINYYILPGINNDIVLTVSVV